MGPTDVAVALAVVAAVVAPPGREWAVDSGEDVVLATGGFMFAAEMFAAEGNECDAGADDSRGCFTPQGEGGARGSWYGRLTCRTRAR